jgi:hypothetical protein
MWSKLRHNGKEIGNDGHSYCTLEFLSVPKNPWSHMYTIASFQQVVTKYLGPVLQIL